MRVPAVVLTIVATIALAGCGSSGSDDPATPTTGDDTPAAATSDAQAGASGDAAAGKGGQNDGKADAAQGAAGKGDSSKDGGGATAKPTKKLPPPSTSPRLEDIPGQQKAAAGGAKLELKVSVRDSKKAKPRTFTITCPSDAVACETLAAPDVAAFSPVPSGQACTELFGGPQTATVAGTIAGKAVKGTFDMTDGCEISRWQKVVAPLLAAYSINHPKAGRGSKPHPSADMRDKLEELHKRMANDRNAKKPRE